MIKYSNSLYYANCKFCLSQRKAKPFRSLQDILRICWGQQKKSKQVSKKDKNEYVKHIFSWFDQNGSLLAIFEH